MLSYLLFLWRYLCQAASHSILQFLAVGSLYFSLCFSFWLH
ncbi:hypothetical protein PMAG_a0380 [Pseudoalteromonas mariniglutinosa NCIMB 1770]|nr:hypothetical protein [Pseudoalteromonas mariniglutinosa NCIMB 1770]